VTELNKTYDRIFDDWCKLSTDIERKMLIFVILRYCEMLRQEPDRSLSQLALLPKEELEKICRGLESSIEKD